MKLKFSKPKKSSRKGLVRKLDSLVSKYVIAKYDSCVCCGSKSQPTAGHLFSRSAYSTRWDLENVYRQCWPCNYRQKVKGDNYKLMAFAWDKGVNMSALYLRYTHPKKFKDADLQEMITQFEQAL